MDRHVLVVGGTGMLSELVEALAREGGRLSLLSRRASAHARPGVAGFDCDYGDPAAFMRALDSALALHGPVDLAVAWFHNLRIEAPRRLAERVGAPGLPGRYFQVLGSAVADPDRPDRLALAARVAEGLPNCLLRQVILGYVADSGAPRWHEGHEVSAGVLAAICEDRSLSVLGTVTPWSGRPR